MALPKDELARRFTHHPPQDEETVRAHEATRATCGELAALFDEVLPDGREKALALTKIEEAMMWANAAIARNGGPA